MKQQIRFGLLLATALLCAGCFPFHYTDRPGATGRVVDARTHAAVGGARVGLAFSKPEEKQPTTASAVTAPDGKFFIHAKQTWGIIFLLPIDYFPFGVTADIEARGYAPVRREFHSSPVGPAVTDLGDVPLTRK